MRLTRFKTSILVLTGLSISIFLPGQCPEKTWLWNRLVYLRDSSTLSSSEKLKELLTYETKIKSCSYNVDSTNALLMQRIGAAYFILADYLKAAQYMQYAIDIINSNQNTPFINIKHNIRNYYSLGWIYDSLSNVKEKMKAWDSCIALASRLHSSDIFLLKALFPRTQYFFDVGDYHRCMNYATICERVAKEYAEGGGEIEHDAGAQYAVASFLLRVNSQIRLRNYETAESMLSDKIEECKGAGLIIYLGTIYFQLAQLEVQKGKYKAALSNYSKAFEYEREAGYNIGCKGIMSNIGYDIYFEKLNDADNALAYCRKALTYINRDESERLSDGLESLNVLGRIANIYARKGNYDSAYYYYQRALDQIKPGITETFLLDSSLGEVSGHRSMHYLTDLLIDKGDAFIQQYKDSKKRAALEKAISVYKVTDQLLDKIKYQQTELQSKLFWRQDSRRLYEHAIEACYQQTNYGGAFYFFEKSRAVLLQDQFNEQRWVGEENILRETQLEKQILQLQKEAVAKDKSTAQRSESENKLVSTRQELEHLRDIIKSNNPLYYQNFVEKNFITIKDVHDKILDDHQALVELFAGDSAIYVLVITLQRSYLKKIDKNLFDHLSDTYWNIVSNPDLLNRGFDKFKGISGQLYQLIFKGIELPMGRIVFSPDSKYFPFEALVTNTQPLTYFVDDHAVSYTYSARYLLNNFAVSPPFKSNTFMGFAPVQYASALPELSGSDQSLQRMRNYFSNTTNFIRKDASKNNFLNEYYKYRIIQLYTHATDSGVVGEPMIYFSDSVLSLSDLFYEGKPSTSLVVLSACETANGKLYNGEGVFSFSRQFAALGIPTSISNLWRVDNQSTYRITELFYKYLSRGLPSDIALQRAKKEFKRNLSSKEQDLPYYWAASVLIGQSNAIISERPFQWQWQALLGALLFLALFIWIKRFRNKGR
jgi:CHAT domain-containing protein/tetratricopeptide repeat protein